MSGRRPPAPAAPPPVTVSVTLTPGSGVLAAGVMHLRLRCDRTCTILAHVRLAVPSGIIHTRSPSKSIRLHAGRAATIGLVLSPRGVRLLRRALGKHHRALVAQVTVEADAVVPTGGLPVAARNVLSSVRVTR
jgi:hypothetical protein